MFGLQPNVTLLGTRLGNAMVRADASDLPAHSKDYWLPRPLLFEAKSRYQSRVSEVDSTRQRNASMMRPLSGRDPNGAAGLGLVAAQKRELWQRCKAGQSFDEIGRALAKRHSSIRFVVRATTRTREQWSRQSHRGTRPIDSVVANPGERRAPSVAADLRRRTVLGASSHERERT